MLKGAVPLCVRARQKDRFWSGKCQNLLGNRIREHRLPERLRHFYWKSTKIIISFLKKDFIYLFLERAREGEREGEKHQCAVASWAPPTGDLPCNPGMCSGNQTSDSLVCRPHAIHWATPARANFLLSKKNDDGFVWSTIKLLPPNIVATSLLWDIRFRKLKDLTRSPAGKTKSTRSWKPNTNRQVEQVTAWRDPLVYSSYP